MSGHRSGYSLEFVEKLRNLCDTIEIEEEAADSELARLRNEWSKFWDLLHFLTNTRLSLGTKGRLHFIYISSVVLHGSNTWPIKEDDVIRLEKINATSNVKQENKISAVELRITLHLNAM